MIACAFSVVMVTTGTTTFAGTVSPRLSASDTWASAWPVAIGSGLTEPGERAVQHALEHPLVDAEAHDDGFGLQVLAGRLDGARRAEGARVVDGQDNVEVGIGLEDGFDGGERGVLGPGFDVGDDLEIGHGALQAVDQPLLAVEQIGAERVGIEDRHLVGRDVRLAFLENRPGKHALRIAEIMVGDADRHVGALEHRDRGDDRDAGRLGGIDRRQHRYRVDRVDGDRVGAAGHHRFMSATCLVASTRGSAVITSTPHCSCDLLDPRLDELEVVELHGQRRVADLVEGHPLAIYRVADEPCAIVLGKSRHGSRQRAHGNCEWQVSPFVLVIFCSSIDCSFFFCSLVRRMPHAQFRACR